MASSLGRGVDFIAPVKCLLTQLCEPSGKGSRHSTVHTTRAPSHLFPGSSSNPQFTITLLYQQHLLE